MLNCIKKDFRCINYEKDKCNQRHVLVFITCIFYKVTLKVILKQCCLRGPKWGFATKVVKMQICHISYKLHVEVSG